MCSYRRLLIAVSSVVAFTFVPQTVGAVKERYKEREKLATAGPQLMWTNPADIRSRDLYYGSGGATDVPGTHFSFLKEDLDGTNPKFDVKDEYGVKWKVKLGIEAKPETAATRIVWAVGYHTNEDYFVSQIRVNGMPAHLHRGRDLVGADGTVRDARLKRESPGEKKIGTWSWRDNPFSGTR